MEKQIVTKICLKKKKLHNIENYHQSTIEYLGEYRYLDQYKINSLESEVSKSTEIEVILMELKDITIRYTKAQKEEKADKLKKVNEELNRTEHRGNFDKSQEIIVAIGKIEMK